MGSDDGIPDGHGCGYCKDNEGKKNKEGTGSKSHGMWAHQLSTKAYKLLIDRGWRRSGSYVYKPVMAHTCCPQYTIRQPCNQFNPSKSQRKNLKKLSKKLNIDTSSCSNWQEVITAHNTSTRFEVKLVKVGSKEFLDTKSISHEIYKKYQVNVHKDSPDEVTMRQWERFLCSPPRYFNNKTNQNLSAYHQQYWLDGKLIAVGVTDWLEDCYSSVYLYYDPDYSDLSLGTYTALYEIDFCLKNQIPYYYLGYYVPGCSKMEYKAAYKPMEMLCPVTLSWVKVDEKILQKFKDGKFRRMNENEGEDFMKKAIDTNMGMMLYKREIVPKCIMDEENLPEKYDLLAKLLGKELIEDHIAVYVG